MKLTRKFAKYIIILAAVFALMFCEYRWIMMNIKPYRGWGGTVYLEVFGRVDEYYSETADVLFAE